MGIESGFEAAVVSESAEGVVGSRSLHRGILSTGCGRLPTRGRPATRGSSTPPKIAVWSTNAMRYSRSSSRSVSGLGRMADAGAADHRAPTRPAGAHLGRAGSVHCLSVVAPGNLGPNGLWFTALARV
jgi:hypothetical protein